MSIRFSSVVRDESVILEKSDAVASDNSSEEVSVSKAPIAPVMSQRPHLFQALPPDISNYFFQTQLLIGSSREAARNLRAYAQISRKHKEEVMSVLSSSHYPQVSIYATRHAMRYLQNFDDFDAWKIKKIQQGFELSGSDRNDKKNYENERKLNFQRNFQEFMKDYVNFSANLSEAECKYFSSEEMLRQALPLLMDSGKQGLIVLDISGRAADVQIGQPLSVDECNSDHRLMNCVSTHLGRKARQGQSYPSIDLICSHRSIRGGDLMGLHTNGIVAKGRLRKIDLYGMKSVRFSEDCEYVIRTKTPSYLALCVGELVMHSPLLKELSLSGSLVTSKFLVSLAGKLAEAGNLEKLDLSDNMISENVRYNAASNNFVYSDDLLGLHALAILIQKSPCLKEIDLSSNALDNDAADLLLAGLKNGTSNGTSNSSSSSVSSNASSLRLNLGGNQIAKDHPVWADPRVTDQR